MCTNLEIFQTSNFNLLQSFSLLSYNKALHLIWNSLLGPILLCIEGGNTFKLCPLKLLLFTQCLHSWDIYLFFMDLQDITLWLRERDKKIVLEILRDIICAWHIQTWLYDCYYMKWNRVRVYHTLKVLLCPWCFDSKTHCSL